MKCIFITNLLALFCLGTSHLFGASFFGNNSTIKQSYIHKYGAELSKEDWDARGKNGQIITTNTEGITTSQTFSKGILQGNTTYSYPHSKTIQTTEAYDLGKLSSTTAHYPSGIPQKEEVYLSDMSVKISTWYEDGTPKSTEVIDGQSIKDGEYYSPSNELESRVVKANGIKMIRDHQGHFLSQDTITNGQLSSRRTFYPNGEIQSITPYSNGVIQGERKTYKLGGQPASIEEWAKGQKHGLCKIYENGEQVAEIPYVRGKKEGVERHFQNETILVREVTWAKGLRHGATKAYYEDATQTEWYFMDQKMSVPKVHRYNTSKPS